MPRRLHQAVGPQNRWRWPKVFCRQSCLSLCLSGHHSAIGWFDWWYFLSRQSLCQKVGFPWISSSCRGKGPDVASAITAHQVQAPRGIRKQSHHQRLSMPGRQTCWRHAVTRWDTLTLDFVGSKESDFIIIDYFLILHHPIETSFNFGLWTWGF